MKRLAAFLLLTIVAFAACEKKPTEEEIEALVQEKQVAQARAAATPAPTPKPWMWKDYSNPLETKPKPR